MFYDRDSGIFLWDYNFKYSGEKTNRLETKDLFGSLKKLIKMMEGAVGKCECVFFPSPFVTYSSLASSVPQQLWKTLVISRNSDSITDIPNIIFRFNRVIKKLSYFTGCFQRNILDNWRTLSNTQLCWMCQIMASCSQVELQVLQLPALTCSNALTPLNSK